MKKSGCSVLYVVENAESAQFRYRVGNVVEALAGSKWGVHWVLKSELEKINIGEFDLVVILRQTDKNGMIGKFIEEVHRAGKKVLFDLDDLIFDYRDLKLVREATGEKNIIYWAGYIWGIRRIAKKVDGFICTNEFLAGKLKRSFGKPVKVIRNTLNKKQVEVSKRCLGKKRHEGFIVGYFSGSPTHRKDFGMVEPELVRFLESHDDVKLLVVGYMKFSLKMRKLIEDEKVVFYEPVEYSKLQELIAGVDVSIAPLMVNDFTNCKSELKFFEAGVVETTTIASPTYAFEKVISDGENGFLAKPGEWYDKLEYLYKHPKENYKIALLAKSYALKHYYGKEFIAEVEKVYEEESE